MSPAVVIIAGALAIYIGASGRWEDLWSAITRKK